MQTVAHSRRLIAAVLIIAAVIAGLILLPVKAWLIGFLDWVQQLGPAGAVLLAALYTPACLLFLPGSLLTLGAGLAFGVIVGTLAVSAGSVIGAAAAFCVGRTLLRDVVQRRVEKNPRFAAIDRAVAQQGFQIVLLTRLSPIFPFNLLNYAYGVTRVRLRDYVLASWLGMLPGTVLYVYLGSAVKSLADLATGRMQSSHVQTAFFVFGLIATIVVAVLVTRTARRALASAVAEDAAAEHRTAKISAETSTASMQGAMHVS